MAVLAKPMIAAPPDASAEEKARVAKVNGNLLDAVEKVVTRGVDDRRTVRGVTVALSAVMILGAVAVVLAAIGDNTTTAIIAGVVTAAPLLVALVLNPFQYLERSDFMTTWTDVIAATYAIRLHAGDDIADYKEAATDATAQFKALGEVYAGMSAKTLEIFKPAEKAVPEPAGDDAAKKTSAKKAAAEKAVVGVPPIPAVAQPEM